jgi:hypothetical protein
MARLWLRLGQHVRFDGRLSFGQAWRLLGDLTSAEIDPRGVRTLPTQPAIDLAKAVSPFPPPHLGAVIVAHREEPAASAVVESFRRGELPSAAANPEGGPRHDR